MTSEENLLLTAMEECDEISQAISKCLRFGMGGKRKPSSETNEKHVITEYYQLMAVMEMLFDDGIIHTISREERMEIKEKKKAKVLAYQEKSREAGLISNSPFPRGKVVGVEDTSKVRGYLYKEEKNNGAVSCNCQST